MTEPAPFPETARCVVVGAGVGGASIAYHLARLGWREIVIVERHSPTDGTTWHSAGFVGQLRSTIPQTRMIMYSSELYAELERETGLDPGWRGVGGLRVACSDERMMELRRAEGSALTYGLDLELLSPAEAAEKLPIMNTDDVLGAAWLPGDGYLDPELLVTALLAGAEKLGVRIIEHTTVTGIQTDQGRVRAVETDRGTITTDCIVNAAGCAARSVGAMAGAVVPVVPMRHQYVVTAPLDPPLGEVPTIRDPDHIVYMRPENGALLVGGYARNPATDDGPSPLAEPRQLFEEDPQRFAESWAGAQKRIPALRDLKPVKVVNGPEAFTPDGEFILGETEVAGLWVAAGFCVHGLAGAGGVGKSLAEWIVEGQPELDMSGMDIRRFGRQFGSRTHARIRALDAYSKYYDIAYPHEQREAGRPLRRSALYPHLEQLGARFGEKAGWERADWLESNAAAGDERNRPTGWAGHHWSPAIEAECIATRDRAAIFDQSSFAKLLVHGPGAAAALGRICAGDIDRDPGAITYTQMLNHRGGIEADMTVTRVRDDRFRIVTGTASGVRDMRWIRRHLPHDGSVAVDDVTAMEACLCLWGPLSRDILQPLTDQDLGNAAFPFLSAREIWVGPVPVLAQRVTYVGELGWELYCPADHAAALWELLWEAGQEHLLTAGGYRAIESLRLEKGYRAWPGDIDPNTTPFEAGLRFAVDMDKSQAFLGHAALAALDDAGGPAQRLRCLVLDSDLTTVVLGGEPVRAAGEVAGRVTSGGAGYRTGASIAYAYLPSGLEVGARVEVGIFGDWVGASIAREPLYDPSGERIKADAGAVV